ncbi:hypothetical protein GA0070621_4502 [Micromonospora narathiwatensis]|uniref:Ig-like domain-containing protein n=1 Tax=Micromonospora narathiwatensis TaxID=299146 RepID=A0A1A9A977_9ACTN|nr:hypothetical protein GA0070621_4502 [Micromonospora narathiwatensis]
MTQPPIGGATGSPEGPSHPEPHGGAAPPPPAAFPPPPASGHPPYQNPAASYQNPAAPYQNPNAPYPDPAAPYQSPAAPYQNPAAPYQNPNAPYPDPAAPYQQAAAPKKRRGLLIASIVLAAAILLCGGGGTAAFLALRNAEEGEGAKEPAVAVDGFLGAVYHDQDARKAATFVCSAARDDKKIAAKVAEVRKYAEQYQKPRFRWTTPKVDNQTGDRATVSTKVTMITADEKVADQELRFTVVQKTGWWVCEVS